MAFAALVEDQKDRDLPLREAVKRVREMIRPVPDKKIDPVAAAKQREQQSAERNREGLAMLVGSLSGVK